MSDKRNDNELNAEVFDLDDIIAEVKAAGASQPPPEKPEEPPAPPEPDREEPAPAAPPEEPAPPEDDEPPVEDPANFETIGFDPSRARTKEMESEMLEVAEEKIPGKRVILFKSRKAEKPAEGGETEDGEEPEQKVYAEFPVGEDEYFFGEEPYEDESDEPEQEPLEYDFLNISYDDPTRAVKRLSGKLVGMSVRLFAILALGLVSGYLTLGPLLHLPRIPVLGETGENAILTLCAFTSLCLIKEVALPGVWRVGKLRPTLDSLTVFSALCSIVHSLMVSLHLADGAPVSFVTVMCCFFALLAKRGRAASLRRVYKCIEISADPAAVKVVGGKKYRTALKTHVRAVADMKDVCQTDMTEKTSQAFAPVAMIASVIMAAVAGFGIEGGNGFLWSLAVISAMTSPMALCMSSVGPLNRISKRLFTTGAAIPDYRAAVRLSRTKRAVADDNDIFPLGSVHIAGMKITTNAIPMEQALADAAALMRDVGGGIAKAFGDFAREQYLAPRKAVNLRYYEGGISAQVRDDYVLMGSAAFLERMGVRLREGQDKRDAVFLAVNSYEAAIFTLKYTVQPQPYAAFGILGRMKVVTDMAVRDFTISEEMIERRFGAKEEYLHIPPLETRELFWQDQVSMEEPVCAILTRDSFFALAETVGGARRLVRTTRVNLFCAYACCVIGMATMYFLTAMGKAYLASPGNIALYLLIWYLPVWFGSLFMTNY